MNEALKRKISRGEIYWVPDGRIIFPKTRLPSQIQRNLHDGRPVIILQTDIDNFDPEYPLVLIAPLSHKINYQSDKDYKLNKGQGNLPYDSIIQLGHIQPILKIDLGSLIGKLDDVSLVDVDAVIASNLGLIDRTT